MNLLLFEKSIRDYVPLLRSSINHSPPPPLQQVILQKREEVWVKIRDTHEVLFPPASVQPSRS